MDVIPNINCNDYELPSLMSKYNLGKKLFPFSCVIVQRFALVNLFSSQYNHFNIISFILTMRGERIL